MTRLFAIDSTVLEIRIAVIVDGRVRAVEHVALNGPRAERLEAGDWAAVRIGPSPPGATGAFVGVGQEDGFLRLGAKAPPEGQMMFARVVCPARGEKLARLTLLDQEAAVKAGLTAAAQPGRVRRRPDPVVQALHGAGPSDTVRVQGREAHSRARAALDARPMNERPALDPWPDTGPALFEELGIEDAIVQALRPVVPLPSGGRLIIETTQAFTAVDVDTGAAHSSLTVLLTQAGAMLAQAIALRRIGGTIVVDCPGAKPGAFVAALQGGCAALGLEAAVKPAGGGLVVVRLARTGLSLAEDLTRSGAVHRAVPPVLSFDAAAARMARTLVRDDAARRGRFVVEIAPAFQAWLRGAGRPLADVLRAAHPLIADIAPNAKLADDAFELVPVGRPRGAMSR